MIAVTPQLSFDELAARLEQQAEAIARAHGEAHGEASADGGNAWRRADLLWPAFTVIPSNKGQV